MLKSFLAFKISHRKKRIFFFCDKQKFQSDLLVKISSLLKLTKHNKGEYMRLSPAQPVDFGETLEILDLEQLSAYILYFEDGILNFIHAVQSHDN